MKKAVELDLPSVLGMGISGPVLAFLTASLYSAFRGVFGWEDGAYACIMFVMSAILAVVPSAKSDYSLPLKVVMWPIASVMIFASAWGSNTGMSVGEGALEGVSGALTMSATAPMDHSSIIPEVETPDSGSAMPPPPPVVATPPMDGSVPAGVPSAPSDTIVIQGSNVVEEIPNRYHHRPPSDVSYLENKDWQKGRFFRRIGLGL